MPRPPTKTDLENADFMTTRSKILHHDPNQKSSGHELDSDQHDQSGIISSTISSVVHPLDTASNLWHKACDVGESCTHKIGEVCHRCTDKLGEVCHSCTDKISDVGHKCTNKLGEVVDKTKDALHTALFEEDMSADIGLDTD